MEQYLDQFVEYLSKEKEMAENSLSAYRRDLTEFYSFLSEKGVSAVTETTNTEIVAYLLKLKGDGRAAATINRKVASLRAFFNYLVSKGELKSNPAANIKSPKVKRQELEYLTIAEVETLLEQPDESAKGLRDRAILEVLYATGIRVTELVELNVGDVNLRMGFITCTGEFGKARIIPLGKPSRIALEEYIYEDRKRFLREKEEDDGALFLNYYGNRLTRQGLWKILQDYAGKAKLEHKLTPQTLRNSFAVHMVQNGADLKSLQELLGHEDITATQIYLSVTKNRIKDVYDKAHPRA